MLPLAVLFRDLAKVITHHGKYDGISDKITTLGVDAPQETPELLPRRIEHPESEYYAEEAEDIFFLERSGGKVAG
jgi:hypothetical protein